MLSAGVSFGAECQDKYNLNPTRDPTSNNNLYIPKNLEDAFDELKKMLHPDFLKEMKEGSEDDMIKYHIGMGLWMRNNWGLAIHAGRCKKRKHLWAYEHDKRWYRPDAALRKKIEQ